MRKTDSTSIIWVHEDALGLGHPVFTQAGDGAARVFVWDEAYFKAQGYSLKRLVFIYECLLDIPKLILYKGDTRTILAQLARGRNLFVASTPNPEFQHIIKVVSENCHATLISSLPFSAISDNADMGRFFRYWNGARKSALSIDGIWADGIK